MSYRKSPRIPKGSIYEDILRAQRDKNTPMWQSLVKYRGTNKIERIIDQTIRFGIDPSEIKLRHEIIYPMNRKQKAIYYKGK